MKSLRDLRQGRPGAAACAALALAAGLAATALPAQELDPGQEGLLRNARLWASRDRLDLARQNLSKLLALDPDSPQALAMLGDIALRENDAAQAQRILAQLRARHPGHSATADLATLARIYGPDREKLERMRLLARAGRKSEAAQAARELFPQGPPTIGGLAAEYHRIVGSDAGAAPQAASALGRLYQATGDAQYRLAQLEVQLGAGAAGPALARQFEALAQDPQVHPQRLRDLWRRALNGLDGSATAEPHLRAYLQRYPDDEGIAEQLAASRQAAARAERQARDPGLLAQAAGQRALDAGDLARAEVQWLEAVKLRSQDADSLGGLGLVRLRQGRHAQAQTLFAQAQRLSPQRKWQDLLATAQFWGLLRQAGDEADSDQLDEAARHADQARALQPDSDDALVLLAAVRARQGRQAQAQVLYEQALAANPSSLGALRGLAALHVQAGRAPQALALLESAQRSHPQLAQQLAAVRADILQAQAEAQQERQPGAALRLLEQALELAPQDPWLRHRLARLYLRLGQPREALGVMDEGIGLDAGDAQMRHARALIRSAADDDAGALADLEHISPEERSDAMRALLRSASVRAAVARAAAPGANPAPALAQAEQLAGDDPELLQAVANAWFRSGQPGQGVAVFDRLAGRASPLAPATRLEHAALLARAADDARLAALLPSLLAEPGWTPEQAARLFALHTSHLERRVEVTMAAGQRAQALALARTPLYAADAQPPGQQAYARGRLLLAAADYLGAAQQLQQAAQALPDDAGVRLALGDALARQGHQAQAREQALWLQQHLDENDAGARLALLRLWQRLPDAPAARALAQQLLERFPQDPDVLLHAARLERSDDRYAQALAYFRQAQPLEADRQAREKIAQDIQAIEARRQAWVEVGLERLQKSSDPGISSLQGWELPAVAWLPRGYDGHHFLHVDRVRLGAGALPASAQDALAYGQVAAWPESAYPTTPGLPRGDGMNVGFGYRGRGIEWDVGAIGIGMPVTNLVGSVARSEWSEAFSWRAELSRRPVTGSLLSYAGVRDPVTGQVWGGVVATGLSGRISRPVQWGGATYGTSFSASYALLQGRNVRDNTRLQLRAAIDRDVLQTAHGTVNVGAALAWWSYARDLSEFSWGHGGYYSPRRYLSLSLPLEWGGRSGAFTWLVRGSVSASLSSSRASDYYPTSAALQAQAAAQGHTPVYAGSGSTGVGRALRAALEYQATPGWALGAQLSLDRSAYYAPTTLTLYLRASLGPALAPMQDRPRPVQTYSSF